MEGEAREHRLLDRFGDTIDRWPRSTARVLSLLLIPLLGIVDYLSGPQVAFSVFYLVPLAVLGWTSSNHRSIGATASVLAALTWLLADVAAGAEYDAGWIPVWNTVTRLTIFLIVVNLLSNLRDAVAQERELARLDPLTRIHNGRSFLENLDAEVRRARRTEFHDAQVLAVGLARIHRLGDVDDPVTADLHLHFLVAEQGLVGLPVGDEQGIFVTGRDQVVQEHRVEENVTI